MKISDLRIEILSVDSPFCVSCWKREKQLGAFRFFFGVVENRYFNEQERKETLKKKTGKEKLLEEKFAEGK